MDPPVGDPGHCGLWLGAGPRMAAPVLAGQDKEAAGEARRGPQCGWSCSARAGDGDRGVSSVREGGGCAVLLRLRPRALFSQNTL